MLFLRMEGNFYHKLKHIEPAGSFTAKIPAQTVSSHHGISGVFILLLIPFSYTRRYGLAVRCAVTPILTPGFSVLL